MADFVNTVRGFFGMDYPGKPGPSMKYTRPEPWPWPSLQEVMEARDYNARFGNSNERMIDGPVMKNPDNMPLPYEEPGTVISTIAKNRVSAADREGWLTKEAIPRSVTQEMADALYAEQMAANRNPIASLGYDEKRMTFSPPDSRINLTHAGVYDPSDDRAWAYLGSNGAAVHEATHRGLRLMRDSGSFVKFGGEFQPKEEDLVRALMLRNHGGIEKGRGPESDRQIARAESIMKDRPSVGTWLDNLEAAAGADIAKRNMQRGPL